MCTGGVRDYSRHVEILFRPRQKCPEAFLSKSTPPELLEKDISDFDFTTVDRAKSCASGEPTRFELNDGELGVPVRLDR